MERIRRVRKLGLEWGMERANSVTASNEKERGISMRRALKKYLQKLIKNKNIKLPDPRPKMPRL